MEAQDVTKVDNREEGDTKDESSDNSSQKKPVPKKRASNDHEPEQCTIEVLNHASDVYEFQKQLGRGSFGKVYQALHKPTGELVAVKVRSFYFSKQSCFLNHDVFTYEQMLRSCRSRTKEEEV